MFAADGDGGEDVFFVARKDDADGDLAVVGAVGGVESAAAGVEADVAAEMAAESGFEGGDVGVRGLGGGGFEGHGVDNIFFYAAACAQGHWELFCGVDEGVFRSQGGD